jgi:hypothetical protein
MTMTYALMERLEDMAKENPVKYQVLKKANVKKLLKDGEKVIGLEYEFQGQVKKEYGPVVLATGGYAADFTSDSLLRKYRPELWDLPTTNGDHCTGDGIKMTMNVGGNTIHMDKVQVHPTGLVDPNEPDAKVKVILKINTNRDSSLPLKPFVVLVVYCWMQEVNVLLMNLVIVTTLPAKCGKIRVHSALSLMERDQRKSNGIARYAIRTTSHNSITRDVV